MPTAPPPDPYFPRRRALGENIREARLHANLTQETVALRMGIDRSSVVEIERGRRNMTINTLMGLADAIGVPLADLIP